MSARTVLLHGLALVALLTLSACSNLAGYEALPYTPRADAGHDSGDAGHCVPREGGNCSCTVADAGTCGDAESCCLSLPVEGGTFNRSYLDNPAGLNVDASVVSAPAQVSTFRLDKFLVTTARFLPFAAEWNSGAYRPAAGSGKHAYLRPGALITNSATSPSEPGWDPHDDFNVAPTGPNLGCDPVSPGLTHATWQLINGQLSYPDNPMNCVTWAEAYAFCIWDGGFLPTETEWEYAAAGGALQREYPWGDVRPGTSNAYAIFGGRYPPRPDPRALTASVGYAAEGAGRFGQVDLAGNVNEWTLDWWTTLGGDCMDCVAASPPSPDPTGLLMAERVIRGGSFFSPELDLLPPSRSPASTAAPPSTRSVTIGFRCARAP